MVTHSILGGEFHGQKRLVGYNSWVSKELDMTEGLITHTKSTGWLKAVYEEMRTTSHARCPHDEQRRHHLSHIRLIFRQSGAKCPD